jgi:hypothetical protein
MTSQSDMVTFVTFACRNDVSYAKALLGSIGHFYPDHPIRVVLESDVSTADEQQLKRFPNVRVHRVSDLIAQHKCHLTRLLAKLNVLFLPGVERALVADADSVLVDTVLDRVPPRTLFMGFRSHRANLDDPQARRSFSDWAIDLDAAQSLGWKLREPQVTFVGGSHFFVDVSRFPRQLVFELLPLMGYGHDTRMPLRAGDQGFWTYFANVYDLLDRGELHFADVAPDATKSQSLRLPQANDLAWIAARRSKEISFIHYIGFSRRFLRRAHEFPTALSWATETYYERIGSRWDFIQDEARRVGHAGAKAIRRLRAMAHRCS